MEKGTAMIGTPKSFDSYRCVPVPANFRYCARLLRDTDKKFVWEMDKRLDYPCNPSTFRTKYKEAMDYMEFLNKRRSLMALLIKKAYSRL